MTVPQVIELVDKAPPFKPDDSGTGHGAPVSRDRRLLVPVRDMIANVRPPDWQVTGRKTRDAIGLIFAEREAAKTALCVAEALHIERGHAFAGADVHRAPVVYVSGEGNAGMARRVVAAGAHHGLLPLDDARIVFTRSAVALGDAAAAKALHDEIAEYAALWGEPPGAIYVDTLARNSGAGTDENSTADGNRLIDSLDRYLREPFGACVTMTHHVGHGDKSRARGAYAIGAALDFEYRLDRAGDVVTVTCTKSRDFEPPPPIAFRIVAVPLRLGDTDTTGVTVEATDCVPAAAPVAAGLGKAQRQMLDLLRTEYRERRANLAGTGVDPEQARVSLTEWRDRGIASGAVQEYRQAFHKVREALSGRNLIRIEGAFVYLNDPVGVT